MPSALTIFAFKRLGGGRGKGLVTGFSNTDYNHTGNQQQRSERSVYQLFQD